MAALALVALAAPLASATAVDIDLQYAPLEDTGCRAWSGSGSVTWNLTLAMNGTDSSLVTTPTYVFIDPSTLPVADGWIFIAAASTPATSPPAYDDASSNSLALSPSLYNATGGLDLYLYSAAHAPPAPPANITITLTPSASSANQTYRFNVTALTHRSGSPNTSRTLSLCISYPIFDFTVGRYSTALQAAADSDIVVSFWLSNAGNTKDTYGCAAAVSNSSWPWSFMTLVNNRTGWVQPGENITIRVLIHVPTSARARANATVSVNCTATANATLWRETESTLIDIVQYYYCRATLTGDSTLALLPGDTAHFAFTIDNLGNGVDNCTARLASPPFANWTVDLTPASVVLAAHNDSGYQASGSLNVTIPADALVFTYDFTVNITSGANITTPITQLRFHVQVTQVYVPQVDQPGAQTGIAGQEVLFAFTIGNGGNGLDSMLIDVTNVSGWRVFLSPPIGEKLLQPGEQAAFQATVIVPKAVTNGTYHQTVRITSKYAALDIGADVFVTATLTIVIGKTCGVGLTANTYRMIVDGYSESAGSQPVTFSFTIANGGNSAEEFWLSLENDAGFTVSFDPARFTVAVNQARYANMTVTVPDDLDSDAYTLTLRAGSTCNTTLSDSVMVDVEVTRAQPAFAGNFTLRVGAGGNISAPQDFNLSGGSLRGMEGDELNFTFTITNTGGLAMPAGTTVIEVYETLDCPTEPLEGQVANCGIRVVQTYVLVGALMAGASQDVTIHYAVPDVVQFVVGTAPESNNRTLRFVIPAGASAANFESVEVHLQVDEPAPPPQQNGNPGTPGQNNTANNTGNNAGNSTGPQPVVTDNGAGAMVPVIVAVAVAGAAVAAFVVFRQRAKRK